MGLRLKFNLVLILVCLVGLAASGYISYNLLHQNAREEVLRNAGLMMETALAIRSYTVNHIKPRLDPQLETEFLPQTVPAFAATETLNELKKRYPDYAYKEATLNPTNLRNRAADWENDIIAVFRNNPSNKEISGERDTPTGRSLFIARPIQIKNGACLSCHTTPETAPVALVKLYGNANGFGWKLDEVVGAQVVSVPMSLPINNANRAFRAFTISLLAVFGAVFIVLNVMLSWLIIRPIAKMSESADQISKGNMNIPELPDVGKDEVASLAQSFNRMSRSLKKAVQMLEE